MPDLIGAPAAPSSLAEHLQDVTEALAAATSSAQVFGVVLRPALAAVGAVAGAVLLVGPAGDRLEIAATHGHADGAQTVWPGGRVDDRGAAWDALKQQAALFFEDEDGLTAAYPGFRGALGDAAPVASAVLPMVLGGQALGVIVLDFREPHHFTAEEKRFLGILSTQCALALGRGRHSAALQAQVAARTLELEQARARAEVLATLGDALQGARSPDDVAALALEPLAQGLGLSSAMVVQLGRGALQAPTIWGEVLPAAAHLQAGGVPLVEVPVLARVARTDEGEYHADDCVAWGGPASLQVRAFAVEPVHRPGGSVAGFLCVWRRSGAEPWPGGDRDLLRRAAGTLGQALERVQHAAQLEAYTQQIEEQRAALDAFVAYKTAVGSESDVLALARQAAQVVRAGLPHVSVAYYEPQGELWTARVWSDDVPPEVAAEIQAGVPADAPDFKKAAQTLRRGVCRRVGG